MNRLVFPAKQAWFILELYTPTYDENACYVSDFTVCINNTTSLVGRTDNSTKLFGIKDNTNDFIHEC